MTHSVDDADISVCAECMEDEFFKDHIRATASVARCSYCDRGDGLIPIAIPLDELIERIAYGMEWSMRMPYTLCLTSPLKADTCSLRWTPTSFWTN